MLAFSCARRGLVTFRNAFGGASLIGFKETRAGEPPFVSGGSGCGFNSTLLPARAGLLVALVGAGAAPAASIPLCGTDDSPSPPEAGAGVDWPDPEPERR